VKESGRLASAFSQRLRREGYITFGKEGIGEKKSLFFLLGMFAY
jgi:hypothetical protein